ncbi:hypothetical protein WJX74_003656 [Apatococcus lobatus]|uniref:Uncharacterized protein n=1 Tax=Apatococcus lobatus TaxID=904363 RepID=A0AAW1QJA2_9CHLO
MALLATRQRSQLGVTELARQHTKDAACWFRDYLTAIKHGRWHPFTLLERKVRAMTRNEPWGPTGTALNELADLSMNRTNCDIIFAVIIFRLGYPPVKWRNVYKALTVLEFLIKRGSGQCVDVARQEVAPRLAQLQLFSYVAPDGKDQGVNVSHRAAAIQALLGDEARLQQERDLYKQRRSTYQGFARDEVPAAVDQPTPSSMRDAYLGSNTREEVPAPSSTASGTRNAGEMKGVTMEENRRRVTALKAILDRAENRQCADCQASGGTVRPSWASINTGVFICMRCAGIHRGLGVHISKVRSCTLDTWLQSQVDFMDQTGNGLANAYWEGKYDASQRPASGPELEAFIRRKYNGEWAQGTWPPPIASSTPEPVSASLPEELLEPVPEAPAGVTMPEEDLLRWDSDNEGDFQPLPGHLFEQNTFGVPEHHQQAAVNSWNSSSGVPVAYPSPSHSIAAAGSASAPAGQAWGHSNVAGLQELHLAPDQSAALQAFVGRSLMDDHMHMAGTGSQLPPAMDIFPLTPRANPAAAPLSGAGSNPTEALPTAPNVAPAPNNALVPYQAPAQPLAPPSSMAVWHQPGMNPSMTRFDGPQHQMSFEDNTDFSQPAPVSTAGLYSQASVQYHQQMDGPRSAQPMSMGSSRPSSAGSQAARQPQQQQPSQHQRLQVSADPLENLVRQAMYDYNLPQPKAAVWLPEGPKVDQSLMAVKQRQVEAQSGLVPRTQVSVHSDASSMRFAPPTPYPPVTFA